MGEIVSGLFGMEAAKEQGDAAKEAAATSAEAAKYATDLQKQIYEQTRSDQTPWRAVGSNALNQLAYSMGIPSQQNYPTTVGKTDAELRAMYLPQYTKAATGVAPAAVATGEPNGGLVGSIFEQQLNGNALGGGTPSSIDEAGLQAAIDTYKQQQSGQSTPFVGTGAYGYNAKNFGTEDFQADPGYQFRLSEGMKALDRSAAAGGNLLSGQAVKGAQRFGQDLASQEYQNAFNRYNTNRESNYNKLANIAGLGQTANSALNSAGSQYASNVGNLAMTNAANQGNAGMVGANANASMYKGIGNALGNTNWGQVGSAITNWASPSLMNVPGNTIVGSGYDASLY